MGRCVAWVTGTVAVLKRWALHARLVRGCEAHCLLGDLRQ